MTKLHTTTVRFDADTWADLSAEAERLGVPKAAYIREATLRRLAAQDAEIERLVRRTDVLERTVARIVRVLSTRASR